MNYFFDIWRMRQLHKIARGVIDSDRRMQAIYEARSRAWELGWQVRGLTLAVAVLVVACVFLAAGGAHGIWQTSTWVEPSRPAFYRIVDRDGTPRPGIEVRYKRQVLHADARGVVALHFHAPPTGIAVVTGRDQIRWFMAYDGDTARTYQQPQTLRLP